MADFPDRWLMATSEWVRLTRLCVPPKQVETPIPVNPMHVAWVEGEGSGAVIHMASGEMVRVIEDLPTVMDRLSGKRT